MEDYFVGSENAPAGAAPTNGAAAAAAAAGDETMAEISVSIELLPASMTYTNLFGSK
jgi:hypothetical protein